MPYVTQVDPVELSELCKPGMHHPEYITYLKVLCSYSRRAVLQACLPSWSMPDPPTSRIQTLCANAPDPLDGCVGIDPGGDTFINNKTLLCGLKTAGAIERAVHEVKRGAMCAYVVCRRPGTCWAKHHMAIDRANHNASCVCVQGTTSAPRVLRFRWRLLSGSV